MRVYEASITYKLISQGEDLKINTPESVVSYLESAFAVYPLQEAFYAVYLNRRNRPLGRHMISLGTLSSTPAEPCEVFRGAILAGSAAMIVAHNHPSGDPTPSQADSNVTRKLGEGSKILDIQLLDHVIVGTKEGDPQGKGYFSFREAGML
jgi:DNA repair protein RadC